MLWMCNWVTSVGSRKLKGGAGGGQWEVLWGYVLRQWTDVMCSVSCVLSVSDTWEPVILLSLRGKKTAWPLSGWIRSFPAEQTFRMFRPTKAVVPLHSATNKQLHEFGILLSAYFLSGMRETSSQLSCCYVFNLRLNFSHKRESKSCPAFSH